jgi:hypothetical protein
MVFITNDYFKLPSPLVIPAGKQAVFHQMAAQFETRIRISPILTRRFDRTAFIGSLGGPLSLIGDVRYGLNANHLGFAVSVIEWAVIPPPRVCRTLRRHNDTPFRIG